MKRTLSKLSAVGLVFVALLTACQKEEQPGRLELTAEGLGSGAKMYSNYLATYWSEGDKVNINGREYNVEIDASPNRAYVSDIPSADTYIGVFPSRIYKARNNANLTVVLPHCYQYQLDDSGHQLVDAPMAAYYNGSGQMIFKHLTGALTIKFSEILRPSNLEDLVIDRIVVRSTQGFQLSGEITYNISNIDANVMAVHNESLPSSNYEVEMRFDKTNFGSLQSNCSIQIPVPAAGIYGDSENKEQFQIVVECHAAGQKYIFDHTQTAGGSLQRAELGYVPIAFTTSNTTLTTLFQQDNNGYFLINNPTDFRLMTEAVTGVVHSIEEDFSESWYIRPGNSQKYKDANFLITSDIDMNWSELVSLFSFGGIIDGGGHTVSHLKIVDWEGGVGHIGLISYARRATVKNITIDSIQMNISDPTANFTDLYGGAIASSGSVTVNNVSISNLWFDLYPLYTTGNTSYNFYIGGFGGNATMAISNSNVSFQEKNIVTMSANDSRNYIGGIVGSGELSTTSNVRVHLNNIWHTVGHTYIGGISGYSRNSTSSISDCEISGFLDVYMNPTGAITSGKVFAQTGLYGDEGCVDAIEGANVSNLRISVLTRN